jgi:hypothetical protein
MLNLEPPEIQRPTPAQLQFVIDNVGLCLHTWQTPRPKPFLQGYCPMFYSKPDKPVLKEKKKWLSLVLSKKKYCKGHQYRHLLCRALLQDGFPIDVFGRGSEEYEDEYPDRVQGAFEDSEPYDDYAFTISIENNQAPHYFTEKYLSPLARNCTTMYLGAPNITDYFGEDFGIKLTGQLDIDVEIVRAVFSQPALYTRNLEYAKQQLEADGKAHIARIVLSKN